MNACKKKGSKYSQTASKKYVLEIKLHLFEISSTLTETKDRITAFSGKPHGTSSSEADSDQEAPI